MKLDDMSLMKKSMICSTILHVLLIISGFLSTLMPKQQNMLLMDVEFAGEGELQEALEKESLISEQEEHVSPKKKPEKESEKAENIVEEKEEPQEEVETKEVTQNSEESISKTVESDSKEEDVLPQNEEKAVPEKREEKPKKKIVAPKKKSLQSIVKNAEKERKKKKLIEAAQKAAKKKKADDEFRKMMSKSISDIPKSSNKTSGKGKKGSGSGSFGNGVGVSESDYAFIGSQIYPHWVVPSGVKDAENIIIEIRVKLRDNGEVYSTKIIDEMRYDSDYIFRAAADSARRAVLEASPLNIPKGKIDLFREFIFRFNLKEALGG